jgi:hypothetical protein
MENFNRKEPKDFAQSTRRTGFQYLILGDLCIELRELCG